MRRPIFWAAVSLTAGLVFPTADIPCWCWGGCALAALVGSLFLACRASTACIARLACTALVVGFFAAGRVAAAAAARPRPDGIASLLARHPGLFEEGITLTGTLARAPSAGLRTEADDVELLLDVRRVRAGGRAFRAGGRVRLRAPSEGSPLGDQPASWVRGAEIKCYARVFTPSSYVNPGAFDSRRHLLARGIHATGTIKSWRLIESRTPVAGGVRVAILRDVDALRRRLLDTLDASFAQDVRGRRASAVGGALLLGERSGLTPRDALALQEAGLSHLLAVSGFNVAVLAASLLLGLRALGFPPRLAALAILPALGLYLLLNQEESSVARAVVMAVAWFAGRAMWRKPDLLSTLGLAALAILLIHPLQVHDPGFQLTFAATLSLISLRYLLPRPVPPPPGRGSLTRTGRSRRAARLMLEAAAATTAAIVGTLPLAIEHFHRVTPGALPANLVAGPMMAAAFVVLMALEVVSPFSAALARGAACCATALIDWTFVVAEGVSQGPMMRMMSWRRADPGSLAQWLFVLSLIGIVRLAAAGRLRGRAGGLACLASIGSGILLAAPVDTRRAPEGLRITMLDVGQGDASLVETPMRRRILVDAGGSPRGTFDVGERVVSQALWAMGIQSLDVVAVTHDDADHLGGAASVVANFHPREVWLPEGAQHWPPGPGIERLRAAAIKTGASLRHLARGSNLLLPGAEVLVMNPPSRTPGGVQDTLPDNESSLVLLVRHAGRLALLTGDAGARTERLLMNLLPAIDVLKVGHHGSRTSTSAGFIAAARPKVALISCGRNNRFGHPSREVVERLAKAGARLCRTDLDGAVSVELLGGAAHGTLLSPSCALSRRPKLTPN